MASELAIGHRTWSMIRDEEGYRTYSVKHLIRSDLDDGPFNVLQTPGLPLPGSIWSFASDIDPWVWCKLNAGVIPLQKENEAVRLWEVEQVFSNRPDGKRRCQEQQIEDPLLEPDRISGDFRLYSEEATHDRFGDPITNSAHEMMRGAQVEFDVCRPVITIVQQVADLQLATLAEMVNTLNDAPLWNLPTRCIRLSAAPWEKLFYGTCFAYFRRSLTFETHTKMDANGVLRSGWDRDLLDEGSKVLSGRWATPEECVAGQWILQNICGEAPSKDDPTHFVRYKDRNGENARVVLDGNGVPAETHVIVREQVGVGELGTGTMFHGRIRSDEGAMTGIGEIHVQKYRSSNFLLLGIPVILP